MSRLPSINSPYRFQPDARFVVVRRLLVNGTWLEQGDLLPADSPLRNMPRRIEYFIRTRFLAPQTATAPRKTEVVAADRMEQKPDPVTEVLKENGDVPAPPTAAQVKVRMRTLATLTVPQLQEQARLRGVSAGGNKQQLINRLSHIAA